MTRYYVLSEQAKEQLKEIYRQGYWLKTQSNQYQTHINAVLRAYYEANKSNKQS
jgi:plasmid stabilization system protein ParE